MSMSTSPRPHHTAPLDVGLSALVLFSWPHFPPLIPFPPPLHLHSFPNIKVQENWEWLGAGKLWRRLEWEHSEQSAETRRLWPLPLRLCQQFSPKVPFQSPFLSHPSSICFAMLSSFEMNHANHPKSGSKGQPGWS